MNKPEILAGNLAAKLQYERAIERMTSKDAFEVEHTINPDWFEAMASGAFIEGDNFQEKYEFDNGNIILSRDGEGSKIFKHRYHVYVKNKLFAKIHCHPRMDKILKPDYIQFQVMNNVLYEVGWLDEIKYVFNKLSWKMLNLTRFDIALDGVQVMDLVDQYNQRIIGRMGRAKLTTHEVGDNEIEGFDVGRTKGWCKMITGYNKTKELKKSNKNYIEDFWKKTGLKIEGREIQRLELKIKNEEIKKIVGFDWHYLDNFEYLARIFRTSMKNFFEFIEKSNDSNKTRAKKIEFINWDFLGAQLLPRLSTKETTEVYRMKQGSKTCYWSYLASGRKYYADIAQELAINVNCLDWFVNKLEDWKHEYYKKCGHNKDGLVSFKYLLHFETLEMNKQLQLFEVVNKEKI